MVKGREGAMKRDDLLWILQNDDEIRAAILHIVYGENDVSAETVEQGALLENMSDERPPETEKLQMRLEQVQTRCDALANEKKALEGQLQQVQADRDVRIKNEEKLQGEKEELSKRLGEMEALAREKDAEIRRLEEALQEAKLNVRNLQSQTEKWQKDYEAAKAHHAEERRRRKEDHRQQLRDTAAAHVQEKQRMIDAAAAMQADMRRLEQRKSALEKANRTLQEQLAERFARGWELFEQYPNVSEHTRQILHNGVFTQEASFMSFICGGAQPTSLEKLWEALRDCIMRGEQSDAEILWDIFEYCLELVNASRTQAKYEILAVEEGDSFDPDCHTEGPDSKAQGTVRTIYLHGYRNTYGDKIMKKSIVQVG